MDGKHHITKALSAGEQLRSSRAVIAVAIATILIGLVMLPDMVSGYEQRVIIYLLFAIILATSYNIISGLAGYASFGHAVFVGIGAYTAGILLNTYEVPFLWTIPMGGLTAALFAAIIGLPILRLRGHYFAIATIGLQLGVMRLFSSVPFFGGGQGWTTIAPFDLTEIYFMFVALCILTVGSFWVVKRSKFGYGLRALNKNEEQAEMIGVPTTWYKTVAFVLSALFPGLAGVLFAAYLNYISTEAVFALGISIDMIVYALVGGLGSLWGPVVGAIGLEFLSQIVWINFPNLHILFYGIIIMLVVLYLPNGLAGTVSRYKDRLYERYSDTEN